MRRPILSVLAALTACLVLPQTVGAQPARAPAAFAIEDYFKVRTIAELALSDDGRWLAYVVVARDAAGANQRTVLVQRLDGAGAARPVSALEGGRAFAWTPGRNELAFIASRGGGQVQAYDPVTDKLRPVTRSSMAVANFKLSPDGTRLAYQVQGPAAEAGRLYDQLYNGDKGVVIDTDNTSIQNFVDPKRPMLPAPARSVELWVGQITGQAAGEAVKVSLPDDGRSRGYAWSSDGRSLSVTYAADVADGVERPERFSSVGVLDVARGGFKVIAQGTPPAGGRRGIGFSGGEWVPGEAALYIRRVVYDHPWISTRFPSLAVIDVARPASADTVWRDLEVGSDSVILPRDRRRALFETTASGRRTLLELTIGTSIETKPVANLPAGSNWGFRFSGGRDMVFVNESLSRPEEILIRRGEAATARLTDINTAIAAKISYTSREVRWRSPDGVTISGWLLEPPGERRGPRPTIVHVHGGPLSAITDSFAPQFTYWPYPFEVMAQNGYAVFFPNYRGTQSYGPAVGLPDDAKAVNDVISGVQALIDTGVADPAKVGLAGHSHGGLLGPRVLVGMNRFKASSFAEGMPDMVVTYQLMGGYLNREVHDPIIGASLYDDPQRYVDISAALHMKGVSTAMLVEAGAWGAAISNLSLPKAAKRAGMPTEYVVYPKTPHNLSTPSLQREAAQRNLDWFRFWIDGVRDPAPGKAEQYRRWTDLQAPATP